jgi:LCP family protein required for cell wall assembly
VVAAAVDPAAAVPAIPTADEPAPTTAEEPAAAAGGPAASAEEPAAATAEEEPPAVPPTLAQRTRHSPFVAALLSTLLPGLGQWWAGSRRRALIVAAPFLALVIVLVIAGLAIAARVVDNATIVGFFVRPSTLAGLLILDGLLLVYRVAAIADAWWQARRRWPTTRRRLAQASSLALLVVVLGVNVGVHAGVGYLDTALANIDSSALGGDSGPDAILPADQSLPPDDLATPSLTAVGNASGSPSTGPTEGPTASPTATPVPGPAWMADGRLNVLLLGVDSGPGRWGVRTDTMILASVDIATGRAAMFGIPRNLENVPLPPESAAAFPCGCFPGLLNALYTYSFSHASFFPGGDNRGYRAVAGAIETLTGVRLDGVAIIDLNGFVKLVDALGGLKIDIPQPIYDSHYPKPDGTGDIAIYIPAGRHRLNGTVALEYARSRHASSDYSRMLRQQAVLLALRAQIQPCTVLQNMTGFLNALTGTIQTTFTPDDLPDLLRLAARVDPNKVLGFSFDPPDYAEFLGKSDIAHIRTLVRHVFDAPTGEPGRPSQPSAQPTSSADPNAGPTPTDDVCAH